MKNCPTIEEQRSIYARYYGRVQLLSNIMRYTQRLWTPFIAVPSNQVRGALAAAAAARRPRA